MAIYSLSQTPVGRSTHAPGTSSAHIAYISRGGACPAIGAGGGLSTNSQEVQEWLLEQEQADRSNARMIDKIMIAMPRELTSEQRYELAHEYARTITLERTPYFFAIHETGKDASNPHCHLVIRDRDFETGQKVIGFSDSKKQWKERGRDQESATQWIRERWEYKANEALEKAGHSVRIDRRSLEAQREEALKRGDMQKAQELDRKAQIHIGVTAQKLAEKGIRPESNDNYKKTDKGRTRPEYNAEIISLNLEKQLRSRDVSIRTRALFEKEQARIERDLKQRHETTRKEQERRETETRQHHRTILQQLGRDRNAYAEKQHQKATEEGRKARSLLETRQRQEREKQRLEQGRFFARMKRLIDLTGKTAKKDKEAIQELSQRQKQALKALEQKHAREAETIRQKAIESHSDKINTALAERDRALQALEQQKEQFEKQIQAEFQKRAIDRHHAKEALENHIKEQERTAKAQERERAKAKDTEEKQKDTETQRPKQPVKSLKRKREEEKAKRPHRKELRHRIEERKDKERQRQDRLNAIRQTGRERMQERQQEERQRNHNKQTQSQERKTQDIQSVSRQFQAVQEQDNTRQIQEWHKQQHQQRQAQAEAVQQQARNYEQNRQQREEQHIKHHTPQMQNDFTRVHAERRGREIAQELQEARDTPQPNRERELSR